MVVEQSIPQALWIAHDEFKEYHYGWAKGEFVITTPKERATKRIVGKVKRSATSRQSVTMGLLLAPTLGVLRAYLLYKNLAAWKKRKIEKDYGSLVSVGANQTGSMRSETHVNWFLPEVYAPASKKAKRLLQLGDDTNSCLIEDEAPGHCGDVDTFLRKVKSASASGLLGHRQKFTVRLK